MKFIEKIKLLNFKRFEAFEFNTRQNRNILVGDNEAGKSTILQAVDIVLSGSRTKVETMGLETLFHRQAVTQFLDGDKRLNFLPVLSIEIYFNDHGNIALEGLNNSDGRICHGVKLTCEPIDDFGEEIIAALVGDEALFPYEYYGINFSTFAGHPYSPNRRFINHVMIDSSIIGSELATRIYTKSLYEANTNLVQRHQNNHAYRQSKAGFTENSLAALNLTLGDFKFDIKNDSKSSLEQDLMITEQGMPVSQMGKGKQCFIKTEFALQQRGGAIPIDLILIEEPENHLSHLNMKKLINRIEESTQTQLLIATHSNSVCSRLDIHNAFLLSTASNILVSLKDLPVATANYFVKAPNNKILEFILSKSVVLVEGDAEFMLVEGMYKKIFNEKLEDSNIHVISVDGTSFKRYLDLATLLGIKTAVVRDNDGDFQTYCINNYLGYRSENIQIFHDDDNNKTTFEKCVYQENMQLCDELFAGGRRTLTVQDYMLKNKTDAALKLLNDAIDRLAVPDYISRALTWIRE